MRGRCWMPANNPARVSRGWPGTPRRGVHHRLSALPLCDRQGFVGRLRLGAQRVCRATTEDRHVGRNVTADPQLPPNARTRSRRSAASPA